MTPGRSKIIFTETLYNHGNGYNNNTGAFTAPVAGTYLFTGQLCSNHGTSIYTSIIVDGEYITRTRSYDDNSSSCCSFDVIVMLDKSSNVVIWSHSTNTELFTSNYSWNTFTGVLLHY